MRESITIRTMGQQMIIIQWRELKNHAQLFETISFLKKEYTDAILEMVPTYKELAIYLHQRVDQKAMIKEMRQKLPLKGKATSDVSSNLIYHIPVCYDVEKGLDLERMARDKELSIAELIQLHSEPLYQIHFIGFLPGFPYLSGLDQRLHQARLKEPRSKIPKGAVGIAGAQTGVYPVASPGGWNIIGQTPVELFSKESKPPAVLQAGRQLRFEVINSKEFKKIEQQVKKGEYKIQTSNG